MALKLLDDLVDVYLGLVILGLDGSDILLGLVEQTEQALFLLRVKVHALKLNNKVAEHRADLAKILCTDGVEGRVGKFGDILLGVAAVVENLLGVEDIDLLGKFLDSGLLGRGELFQFRTFNRDLFLNFFLLLLGSLGNGLCIRLKGQAGNVGFFFFVHSYCPFFY